MAHPPRSNPPLRSSSGPPNPCITPSTETLVVVVNLMSWSPPHAHAWCAHEARIASRRRGVLSETDVSRGTSSSGLGRRGDAIGGGDRRRTARGKSKGREGAQGGERDHAGHRQRSAGSGDADDWRAEGSDAALDDAKERRSSAGRVGASGEGQRNGVRDDEPDARRK